MEKRKWLLLFGAVVGILCAQAQDPSNYKGLLRDQNVKVTSTNLPIVFMNVNGVQIDREVRILARMKVIDNGAGQLNYGDTIAHPNQGVNYDGWVALKYRGNSSFNSSDKKPYSFRPLKTTVLPDDGGDKDKVSILGMGKDNNWALLAPFADKSMMRDILTFELARQYFGYVPHGRYCELILDGTYYGIYILTELPTQGKKRLNLNDPGTNGGDLTGDYSVEVDRDDEVSQDPNYPPVYRSAYPAMLQYGGSVLQNKIIKYQFNFPETGDFAALPTNTFSSLVQQINQMESSFKLGNYTDPNVGYRKYIDVRSFIDYMLATEFSMNIDGYRLSTKFYKYSTTRAAAEKLDPRWKTTLWDFNIAYGNANYYQGESTNVWQYDFNSRNSGDNELVPFYWQYLVQDPAYISEMKARWAEYRRGSYKIDHIYAVIDSMATMLSSGGAIDRNQQAYQIIGRSVWPNAFVGQTYQAEINYLKDWIKRRIIFMDKQLLGKVDPNLSEALVVKDGFNADLVSEGQPSSNYTLGGIDQENSAFYPISVKADGGIPNDGKIVSKNEGVNYQLAPYNGNNALNLKTNGQSATITFDKLIKTPRLYFLVSSGNGISMLEITVHYQDGTSGPSQICSIADWSNSNLDGTEALTILGRIRPDGYLSTLHYSMCENFVETDENKEIASVTIKQTSSAIASVFGFSKLLTSIETGIESININGAENPTNPQPFGIYTVSGVKLKAPQKGLNIVKYSDGNSRKLIIK